PNNIKSSLTNPTQSKLLYIYQNITNNSENFGTSNNNVQSLKHMRSDELNET
ncbi:27507_t:CDS:1, partial [Racocetra persica]